MRSLIVPLFSRYVALRFRFSSRRVETVNDALDFVFTWNVRSRNMIPLQLKSEISRLLSILQSRKIYRMLEIGTFTGGTLFLFSRALPNDCFMCSVDLPKGRFGGGCPDWWVPVMKRIPHDRQTISFVRDDSHDSRTFSSIEKLLGGKPLDFLFVDGDHTYEGVKRDFELYSTLVSKSGIIAFHDIVEHPQETGCEVKKFWLEVREQFHYEEIVKDYTQKWGGIGVLYLS